MLLLPQQLRMPTTSQIVKDAAWRYAPVDLAARGLHRPRTLGDCDLLGTPESVDIQPIHLILR